MSRGSRGRHGGRQGGFVATELALGVGVLLIPVVFLVLTISSWSERQTTGRAIAREVGRAVARDGWCNTGLANGLAEMMAGNLGLARADMRVELDCAPGDLLTPGSELAVSVTVRMPAVHLPAVGNVGEWSWTARHRQPVDLYGSAR
jgi:hypothetical protein